MPATESLWMDTSAGPAFPRLEQSGLHVDVAIIGSGITGTSAALLLKNAGKRVAVLDAQRVASGVSGRTSAHLTQVLDARYHQISRKFGQEGAKLVAESTGAAIDLVERWVSELRIDCDFERLPGYLFTEHAADVDELGRELEACRKAGLSAEFAAPPLPFPTKAALRFANQAQFHPRRYLLPLLGRIPGDGSHVFEGSRVLAIDEGEPCRVHTEAGPTLSAERVIVATHAPLNRVLLQTKLAHYRSYVVSGPVSHAPYGLFWDTADPYHYVRAHRVDAGYHLIVGGEDHKTGQEPDTEAALERLIAYASRFGLGAVTHKWSAQVIEPVDELPFIGANAGMRRVYVATGFSGTGLTFGTLSAMILSDACLGRHNRFAALYDATRIKPLASLGSYLSENVDYPLHLLSDALRPPDAKSVEEIRRGEGKIVRVNGERLAVYRDELDALHAVSPVCTHLGCMVRFNTTEKTWDCPCHGSRFRVDGSVVNGPAVRPLERRVPRD